MKKLTEDERVNVTCMVSRVLDEFQVFFLYLLSIFLVPFFLKVIKVFQMQSKIQNSMSNAYTEKNRLPLVHCQGYFPLEVLGFPSSCT